MVQCYLWIAKKPVAMKINQTGKCFKMKMRIHELKTQRNMKRVKRSHAIQLIHTELIDGTHSHRLQPEWPFIIDVSIAICLADMRHCAYCL